MSTATPKIKDLAQRLLALEAEQGQPTDDPVDEAVKVCEKLRVLISRLVGVAGFASLLSRALSMAKVLEPSLVVVKVEANSDLVGFEQIGPTHDRAERRNAGVALVAQLLGLLTTFIGQSLTLSLVRAAWPDVSLDEMDLGIGGKP